MTDNEPELPLEEVQEKSKKSKAIPELKEDMTSRLMTSLESAMKRIDEMETRMQSKDKELKVAQELAAKAPKETPAIHVTVPDMDKMVEGIFDNKEQKDGSIKFMYGPSNAIKFYEMAPGQKLSVPLPVARNLEDGCSRDRYAYELNTGEVQRHGVNAFTEVTNQTMAKGAVPIGKDQRFSFEPVSKW